uniref:Outer capsid protein n=1 Tax=Aster yellows phytoplasma TaxID=35779 RepID=Q849C4_ASTYP|nr:outer capsid protein [Aster yellows phytoplasma]
MQSLPSPSEIRAFWSTFGIYPFIKFLNHTVLLYWGDSYDMVWIDFSFHWHPAAYWSVFWRPTTPVDIFITNTMCTVCILLLMHTVCILIFKHLEHLDVSTRKPLIF